MSFESQQHIPDINPEGSSELDAEATDRAFSILDEQDPNTALEEFNSRFWASLENINPEHRQTLEEYAARVQALLFEKWAWWEKVVSHLSGQIRALSDTFSDKRHNYLKKVAWLPSINDGWDFDNVA